MVSLDQPQSAGSLLSCLHYPHNKYDKTYLYVQYMFKTNLRVLCDNLCHPVWKKYFLYEVIEKSSLSVILSESEGSALLWGFADSSPELSGSE